MIVGPVVDPAAATAVSLRQLAAAADVSVGSAVRAVRLDEPDYGHWVGEQLSTLTAENELKWDQVEPAQGQFTFTNADKIVQFALDHGQMVRGHTLVWHSALPSWVGAIGDNTQLEAALENHITSVVSHFGTGVDVWDVVNEPLDDNGYLRTSGTEGFWNNRLGAAYIANSFHWAHAANPSARLYLNEYGIESDSAKARGLYELVKGLLAQGVPIHGVGFQTHKLETTRLSGLADTLRRFADLGLDVAITELDVRMLLPADADKLARQASVYGWATAACLAVPRCVSVTTWGFTDRYSWIPAAYPGWGAATMTDASYVEKPAYVAVQQALLAGRPAPDPVAAWRLDEPSGTMATDASSSPVRHPAQAQPGNLGNPGREPYLKAFKGNGSDSSAATASSAMRTDVSFTVSAWVNMASLAGDQVIASQEGVNVGAFTFGHTGGHYYFAIPAADSTSATEQRLVSVAPVVTGEWVHVAAVWNRGWGHAQLFINGVGENAGPLWSNSWASTGAFHIGASQAGRHFHGSISDLRVYQHVLEASEIAVLASPLVGRWTFDGHTGDESWFHRDAAARNNSPLLWTADRHGQAGNAINLAGAQLIDTRGGLPVLVDRSYTLSVWVKLADTDGDGRADATGDQVVLAADGNNISPLYLRFKRGANAAADRWAFSIPVSDTGGAAQIAVTSIQPATAGVWTHLLAVCDRGSAQQMRLFVDGAVAATGSAPGVWPSPPPETGALHIGASSTGNLIGAVDDVQVYQRALSAAEIAVLYTQ
ncbi:hypothetical protein Prum_071540 [Phytohabitans rumicis]|uniref:Beta-xylanase n=1 Tax=Phytohabitans rumicis TaxID=1076125 RepID=A0A6V8L8C7_9ACTN|nr:hypothetical protein Prum_071540 [Phytohabitans rumicis]